KSLRIPKSDSRLIAGTSEYISPEQGMGKSVDIRSDIYSLGVVLYELLMGRPPFKSDGSFTFVVYQHVHSMPPPLELLSGTVPASLKEIIQKCLEKKPERRFQSPEELLSAIVKARSTVRPPTVRTTAALPAALSAPFRADWAWRGRTAALVLVMLIGIACALFAVLHRPQPLVPIPAPDAAAAVDFELDLGLGEFAEAMAIAEARWGKDSPQYQTAAARRAESIRRNAEVRAEEAVALRDWRGAVEAYEKALSGSSPDRRRELASALTLSRDLLRARELEDKNPEEALSLYRRHASRVPSLNPYLRERMAHVQREQDARKPR
ncbi:MAG: hypothetical protein EHM91_05360, partial [Planctomycetota bacterium]